MLIVCSYNIVTESYLIAVRVVYVCAVSLILFWRMLCHVVYPSCVYDVEEGVFMSCIISSNMFCCLFVSLICFCSSISLLCLPQQTQ
jgi:hypothetical protein